MWRAQTIPRAGDGGGQFSTLRIDIRLVMAAGEQGRVPLPFASVLRDNLIDAVAHGDGERDFAALARVASRRANLDGR
jgi:3-hydroxyisobutyrate dehydrogenase-like beta-hydroxyacid dehydrogenase